MHIEDDIKKGLDEMANLIKPVTEPSNRVLSVD